MPSTPEHPTDRPPAAIDALAEPLRAVRLQFERFIEPHRPALWKYCRRLTGSIWDAEDLVQDTLLRAFGALPNLWQPVHPKAWLFRIATNVWIDRVRQSGRASLEPLDEAMEHPGEADATAAALVHDAVERLVQVLPPRQRVVFLLCETFDFRSREVAAMLGTTDGAVKSALQRARATLAAATDAAVVEAPTRRSPAAADVVARYVAAFDARDADALAALLDEEVEVTIVGSATELGREEVRRASLAEWAGDPRPQRAVTGELEGRPVVFVLYELPERGEALAWVTTLAVEGGRIVRQRIYYFCVEFLEEAARQLGLPVVTHGYQYVGPTTA